MEPAPLSDLRLAVIMLDGIELHRVARRRRARDRHRGVEKLALGLVEEVHRGTRQSLGALLTDLVDPGVDVEQGTVLRDRRVEGAPESDPAGVLR